MLPKFLQLLASSQSKIFISARARKKIAVLGMLANACKDHSSPLDLKSSSEHIFYKNWRWAPLEEHLEKIERNYTKCFVLTLHVVINPCKNICCFYCLIDTKKCKKNVELQYIIETQSLVDLGRIMADTVDIFWDIINNHSLKSRWILVVIYRGEKRRGKYS